MTFTAPDHFSYNFKLDIDKTPSCQTDKFSFNLAFWGFVGGILFVLLGAYEILGYFLQFDNQNYNFKLPPEMTLHQLIVLRYSFDTFILLLGIIIIIISTAAVRRRKIIYFDSKKVTVVHQKMFGKPVIEEADLLSYLGVLLKIEYYQIGLITRNRYIIELYHRDKNKCVPLYISTSGKNIRPIWEDYARKLKMPALFITDHGLVSKHYDELNKTLVDMAKRWNIDQSGQEENIPHSVKYRTKDGRTVFKERHAFFDVYAVLSLLFAALLGAFCIWSVENYAFLRNLIGVVGFSAVFSLSFCLMLGIIIRLFCKDVLIINRDAVILGHNFSAIRANIQALPKEEIESVDIGHNPVSGRYYLSIIAHRDNIIFGKNMPLEDLRKIRGCVIREVVK